MNEAKRFISLLNSRAKTSVKQTDLFERLFAQHFTYIEYAPPQPLKDLEFDDFQKLRFEQYQDVKIHGLEIYEQGSYIAGLEAFYLVDGDVCKYSMHYQTKKAPAKKLGTKGEEHEEEVLPLKKIPIYFKHNESVFRVRIQGRKYINFMEIETSLGAKYMIGQYSDDPKINDVDFEVEEGFKIIAFAGVMEVSVNSCRFINFAIMHKPIIESCAAGAQKSPSYKDATGEFYIQFDVNKTGGQLVELVTEFEDPGQQEIRKIKSIKLYPGKLLPEDLKEGIYPEDVVGGIEVFYETKKSNIVKDGVDQLDCTDQSKEPVHLVLSENEYIANITGVGGDFIVSLTVETNFYRKIHMGARFKGGTSFISPPMSEASKRVGQQSAPRKRLENFSMEMPAGAKIMGVAGSADSYLRSVFAYYKI